MNELIKRQILDEIERHDTIILSRHIRPDGDAVGSTMGMREVLRASFPEKKVYLTDDDFADAFAFCGGEDDPPEEAYEHALLIVIDTGTRKRISNADFGKAEKLVKIDHHIEADPYGDLNWVEDFRSSACEMIADFVLSFPETLKVTPKAAEYIYMGMVTDSGRFRFEGVTGETMRLAGALLDFGFDAEWLYANLYTEDPASMAFKSYVYGHIGFTPHGVAYLYLDEETQKAFSLTFEEASGVVGELSDLRGSLIWVAFIADKAKGNIRVRLRSRFLGINDLAKQYHGGGHNMAAGATVYSEEEMHALLADADALLHAYRKEHGDLL